MIITSRIAVPLIVITMTSVFASAEASEELAIQYACVACHEIDYTRLGPPYLAVAVKYKGADKASIDKLVERVMHGSTGLWGVIAMPAMPLLGETDARTLVQWILSMQPTQ